MEIEFILRLKEHNRKMFFCELAQRPQKNSNTLEADGMFRLTNVHEMDKYQEITCKCLLLLFNDVSCWLPLV